LKQRFKVERRKRAAPEHAGPGIAEVVNRPATGVTTRGPEEPCVNSTSTVLREGPSAMGVPTQCFSFSFWLLLGLGLVLFLVGPQINKLMHGVK
jgi:hypothetical protein